MWDLFTKKEEYLPIKLDEHKRFAYEYSIHKNVLQPVVSEYLVENNYDIEYPDKKKFALVLTHDVDDITVKNRHVFLGFLSLTKTRDINNLINLIKGKINNARAPYLNFRKIVEIEKKYNASSSFYFLADRYDIFGVKYDLNDLKDELYYLADQGCDIGLHTSYYSYDSFDSIKDEKNKMEKILGSKVTGVRNHVLRFSIPESWDLLSKAGFRYDSTFGYHDMIGFRNGMCHPFKPYNLNENRVIDILEIPLNIQDMTFLMYLKFDVKTCWEYIKDLIDKVEKLGGVLTLLWHNWTFCLPASYGGIFGKEWTNLYKKILQYCKEKNAWITNAKEIYSFYSDFY
jgi:peptidoglycan/xylan/chitin deacetylase (PgdA/CDA1 family)